MSSSSIEAEYNDIESRNNWFHEFQSIKERSEKEAKDKHFSLEESRQLDNRKFNRYRDVNPYDHSRIVLKRADIDYINANLVKLDRADRKYILTQGPLQSTIGHFWLMVWEQNSRAILMLNKLIEKKQVKCDLYWPEHIGEEHIINLTDVGLSVEYLKCEKFVNFCKRTFRLTDNSSTKSREIIQFHYTTWPDFGIPSSPVAFLQFLKQVRESGALESNVGPPIVHCSAGIGRSGTFCLVDCCLVIIENEGENKVSVQDILIELRRYRMGLIQTVDQLYFSYQAIIEGIKRLNNSNQIDDYEEVPELEKDEDDNDDKPPPTPPPRSLSLRLTGSKPLPVIPASESVHADLIPDNNEYTPIDLLIVNNQEKSRNINSNKTERPLPPLPKENSLEKVEESPSDYDNEDDGRRRENDKLRNNRNKRDNVSDDDNIDDNSDSEDDDDDDDEEIEECHSDDNDDVGDDEGKRSFDPNNALPSTPTSEKNNISMNGPIDYDQESPVSSPDSDKSNAELRRRKRVERQSAMEEKIREIKRKQKISDEHASSSPKKRRHENNREVDTSE